MNENIICYQGLSFQIWVDYKKFWKKKKLFAECHEDDTRRKRLCRVPAKDTRRNIRFAECHLCSTRQRITAVRMPNGRRTAGAQWVRVLGTWPVFAECSPFGTRQRRGMLSAVLCWRPALGTVLACRVPNVCRVPEAWHSAKLVFAECPWSGTRQTRRHSVFVHFPVVIFWTEQWLPSSCFRT